jgi:hypothetical protein
VRPKREGRSKGSRAMAIDDEAGRTDRLRVGSLTFEYENGSSKDMTTQERQPSENTTWEKSLEAEHPLEEKSLEVVQNVVRDLKPVEQLLIKCKDDWIHHLAQALSFSLLSGLMPIAVLLLVVVHPVLGNLDTRTQRMLTGHLEGIIPPPLSSPVGEVVGKAFDTLSHASGIAVFFTLLLAVLFGQMLFSLMESCFDVIYHLPRARLYAGISWRLSCSCCLSRSPRSSS